METIKLTDAQHEVFVKRQIGGARIIRTEPITLEITDRTQFTSELAAAVTDVESWRYTPENAREIFATKYLMRKLTGEKPQTKIKEAAAADPIDITTLEIGTLVYLIDDNDGQDFKVVKINSDQSVQVYGGSTHYRQFRDFNPDLLTTTRPSSMPKLRD